MSIPTTLVYRCHLFSLVIISKLGRKLVNGRKMRFVLKGTNDDLMPIGEL
jgi:hypothetical protein